MVHRDVKPENCFRLTHEEDPDFIKLLDFGIVKAKEGSGANNQATQVGQIIGTAGYMAPEQARTGRIDHRVDIYALGVVMFQGITGSLPFRGTSDIEVLTAILRDEPPPLRHFVRQSDVPDALVDLIARAMQRSPDDRFQTLREFDGEALIVDPHYLGGPRGTDFVLVEITAGRPRSTATKAAFYRRLAEGLQASPGLHPADLMVVITTTQRDEWSFGHGRATLLQPDASSS